MANQFTLLIDRNCSMLDGECECERIEDCKYLTHMDYLNGRKSADTSIERKDKQENARKDD